MLRRGDEKIDISTFSDFLTDQLGVEIVDAYAAGNSRLAKLLEAAKTEILTLRKENWSKLDV